MDNVNMVNKYCVKLSRLKPFKYLLLVSVICIACMCLIYRYQSHDPFSTDEKLYQSHKGRFIFNDSLLSVSNKMVPEVDVVITLTNLAHNEGLQNKFRACISSMFHFSSIRVNLHIIGDHASRDVTTGILAETVAKSKYTIHHLDKESLAKKAKEVIADMQTYFSVKSGGYYSDSLFFLSIVIHRILPHLKRIIMLDADLKFNADIRELYKEFDKFDDADIIGIARENQPVYRHVFHMYRNANKGTRVGDPPQNGLTGFNSGVLLLDIQKMAESKVYNSLISSDYIKRLTEKYMFKGHLGDQDFFTLISLEHEELFHILPCSWNKQLCVWWRDNGYKDVFEQYFRCEGQIKIYHGNCNTEIPKLEWEI